FFFFQAEDGIRDRNVTGVQTCALPISSISFTLLAVFMLSACATGTPSNEGGNANGGGEGNGNNGGSDDNATIAFQENIQTMDPHDGSSGIDISVALTMYET